MERQNVLNEFNEMELDQENSFGFGISGVLGGEYYVTNYFSVLAEYGFVFEYKYSQDEDKIQGILETKEFKFTPMLVKFGFSFNF